MLQNEKENDETPKDKTAPKIHPLAVASARLQSNGLNELNRAINLATLVSTGEFFSYTNVVDPSYDNPEADKNKPKAEAAAYYSEKATSQRTEALFGLKRKRAQFEKASEVLQRHNRRLWDGIQAQHVIDRRLFELRQQWRLVAPEHGTRARLHAARTNEVIAVDVDVYDRDRVHGGNQALMGKSRIGLAGRLASRVPRFATIELRDTFRVPQRKTEAESDSAKDDNDSNAKKSTSDDEEMKDVQDDKPKEVEDETKNESDGSNKNEDKDVEMQDSTLETKNSNSEKDKKENDESYAAKWTRAEPFAVADPTLGRVIENFDPSKIPMLNLQLDIQKSSTGFLQSACLEPMTTISSSGEEDAKNDNTDESLLISLQHSLFCANLFESMRSELDPESFVAGNSFSAKRPKAVTSTSWLASESEENFVAPPSHLVGTGAGRGLGALSVVHCHEGEVKVQLDSEYQLCLKLVEANAEQTIHSEQKKKEPTESKKSGSQSPAQLHAFCRALLLYAQDVYHRHSLYLHEREKKMREAEKAKGDEPRGLARIKKEDAPEKARILQSCVSLGSKMLFEQRIRKALSRVSKWLKSTHGEKLIAEWLSLSMFDLHSKFTICCRQLVVDGVISRDALTITKVTEDTEDYRKVHFRTEKEFEIYLKMELRRQM
mmetsp:Transcript_2399/g.5735  ORF Transcript_2399/g.5735 Transcript_2399/m.5735 type:complete len:661 (-) Transcript_2399:30-2012(-)